MQSETANRQQLIHTILLILHARVYRTVVAHNHRIFFVVSSYRFLNVQKAESLSLVGKKHPEEMISKSFCSGPWIPLLGLLVQTVRIFSFVFFSKSKVLLLFVLLVHPILPETCAKMCCSAAWDSAASKTPGNSCCHVSHFLWHSKISFLFKWENQWNPSAHVILLI